MKKNLLVLALALTLSPSAHADAPACDYCGEMKKLMQDFKKTPVDPENADTSAAQDELVDRSSSLLKKILKENSSHPSDDDLIHFTEVMQKAVPYDGINDLGADVMTDLGPQLNAFYAEIRRLRDTKKISKAQAEATIDAVSMAENMRENGDGEAKK